MKSENKEKFSLCTGSGMSYLNKAKNSILIYIFHLINKMSCEAQNAEDMGLCLIDVTMQGKIYSTSYKNCVDNIYKRK